MAQKPIQRIETERQDRDRSFGRLVAASSLRCAVVLAMALTGTEVVLQAYYRVTTGSFLFQRSALPIYVSDPDRGWAVKPGLTYEHRTAEFAVTLHTNSRGFRVSERREEFQEGEHPKAYRVMLLGPSFAFGWAADFEDSFAGKLQELLEESGASQGRPIEVINAGVPGIPPDQNLEWFRNVGSRYRADLVLQMIHRPLTVNSVPGFQRKVDDQGYLVLASPGRFSRVKRVAKLSATAFYAWTTYNRLSGALGIQASTDDREDRINLADEGAIFAPSYPQVREAMRFYDDLQATVLASGGELVVVMFPPSYCIYSEDVERWRSSGFWEPRKQVPFTRQFSEFINSQGIRCINLYKPLAKAALESNERLYYWLDTHWTPRGNQVAAVATARYLTEQGYPPVDSENSASQPPVNGLP